MKTAIASGLFILALLGVDAAAQTSGPATKSAVPAYRDRYAVLGEGNIFIRDRWRPAYRPTVRDVRPSAPPAERSYLLTGIVREDDIYRAYVEDTSARRVLRLAVGDAVAQGHITEIDSDGITYESNGQLTWVRLGRDLRGGEFAGAIPSAPTTGPALDPNNPNLTMEERMKLRRMAEMGKSPPATTQPAAPPAASPTPRPPEPEPPPPVHPDAPPEVIPEPSIVEHQETPAPARPDAGPADDHANEQR